MAGNSDHIAYSLLKFLPSFAAFIKRSVGVWGTGLFLRIVGNRVPGRGFFLENQDCKVGSRKSGDISHAESELLNFAVFFKPFSEVRHLTTLSYILLYIRFRNEPGSE